LEESSFSVFFSTTFSSFFSSSISTSFAFSLGVTLISVLSPKFSIPSPNDSTLSQILSQIDEILDL
jgi:hypothetical protein